MRPVRQDAHGCRGQERKVHLLCVPVHSQKGQRSLRDPRINAKSLEETIILNIRENVLTDGNIHGLVRILDEEMDGVAREQRERLESIEAELEDVKRRLGRVWQALETTDLDMADASERIKELRGRKERLEKSAEEARGVLSERRALLDRADIIAAFAADMSEFLRTSELTETRAFIRSFVKEIQIRPGNASIVYTIPMPEDSPIGASDSTDLALSERVMNTIRVSGPGRIEPATLSVMSRLLCH